MLKDWVRTSDDKLLAKGNLKDRFLRLKEWK